MSSNMSIIGVVPSLDAPFPYIVWLYSYLTDNKFDPVLTVAERADLHEKPNHILFVDRRPNHTGKYKNFAVIPGKLLSEMWKEKKTEAVPALLRILDTDSTLFKDVTMTEEEEDLFIKHVGMIQRNFTNARSLNMIIRKADDMNEATYSLAYTSGLDHISRNYPKNDNIIDDGRVLIIEGFKCIVIKIPYWNLKDRIITHYLNAVNRDHQLNRLDVIILMCVYKTNCKIHFRSRKSDIGKLSMIAKDNTTMFDLTTTSYWQSWLANKTVKQVKAESGAKYDTAHDVFFGGEVSNRINEALKSAALVLRKTVPSPNIEMPTIELDIANLTPLKEQKVEPLKVEPLEEQKIEPQKELQKEPQKEQKREIDLERENQIKSLMTIRESLMKIIHSLDSQLQALQIIPRE